jgi:hypothetical protein
MDKRFRTSVRIAQSPQLAASGRIRPSNPDPKERDRRPGRYSVVGPFIKLPETEEAKSEKTGQ